MRFLKQFLYGAFYLSLWLIAGFLVYLIFFRQVSSCFDNIQNQDEAGIDCGGVCGIDCELKYISPLTVSRPLIFKNNDQVSLWVKIRNPNLSYGSDKLEYRINLYDSQNNLLTALNRQSFIYAGENKDIVEAGIRTRGAVARAELVIDETSLNWRPAAEWLNPILETLEVKSVFNKDQAVVSGMVKNPSSFSIARVAVTAILNDQSGIPLGVSKTDVDGLSPFQTKNFQIFIPVVPDLRLNLDLGATQIIVEARK